MSFFLIELVLNILLALFIWFQLGLPWAIIYVFVALIMAMYVAAKTDPFPSGNQMFFLEIVKDGSSLFLTLALSVAWESLVNFFQRTFKDESERVTSDGEQLLSISKYFDYEELAVAGEKSVALGRKFSDSADSLAAFNGVFGLSAAELTVSIYIVARLIYLIVLFFNSGKR